MRIALKVSLLLTLVWILSLVTPKIEAQKGPPPQTTSNSTKTLVWQLAEIKAGIAGGTKVWVVETQNLCIYTIGYEAIHVIPRRELPLGSCK